MNFKELLLQAKFGDRTATTELLMLYQPLLAQPLDLFIRQASDRLQMRTVLLG